MIKEMPKAYEPGGYEDKIYKRWELAKAHAGFFNPDNLDLDKGAKAYTIVLPPPNVTGTLHMGHACMLAIEDILVRYHRMKGERALWVPGTDHAAIATQTKVEKIINEEGSSRHKLGREKFLERVNKFASDSHDTIVNQSRKMGASLDWSREAYTLDATREKAVRSVFKLMYDDGIIYRGERIVNWCPRCGSTLADDEVVYKASKSKLFYFKYSKDFPITIATTRPETKLGDTAVAVNPKDERYKKFIGKEYDVNFVGIKLKIKIIADRNVDMGFGAGALGVTPAHSQTDWMMAEENGLPKIKVIDENGNIRPEFKEYSGLSVKAAREKIVENLKASGLLEKEEEIDNNLSLCYRCDTPVEPLPSLQWFIDVNKKISRTPHAGAKYPIEWKDKSIKDISIEVVKSGKIKIVPERFEKSYLNWMENLRDWCISRQIWFGHQVPVWYLRATHNSQLITPDGRDAFNHKKLESQDKDIYVGIEAPDGKDWVQDEDTLDTWFSSGMWTFSTLAHSPDEIRIENGQLIIDSDDFKKYHPTQVLETGYDIIFFWVARMIIMTTYAIGDIPFENVYLHGLVLDEKGKKMSKSKGNAIDPLDMIEKFGTDAARLSLVLGATPGNDMRISVEKVGGFRNMVNKLWNVSRFIQQNMEGIGFDEQAIDEKKLTLAELWILGKLEKLINDTTEDLDAYRFSQAGERLRDFTWNDLADWYLEACKFEESEQKSAVLIKVLSDLLKLWHPFIPFVTEAIWSELGNKDLIIEKWPVSGGTENRLRVDGFGFENIRNVISAIRNARSENKVEPSRKIKAVIYAGKNKGVVEESASLIKNMRTGIAELEIIETGKEIAGEIKIVVDEIVVYLIGAVDEEKEGLRIKKEKENLEKQIVSVKNKLDNKGFIERAPEEVVAQEIEKLERLKKELKELEK